MYRGSRAWLGWSRWVETSCREFEDGHDLLSREVMPFHDFVDRRAGFEVLEDKRNGHTCVFEHPSTAYLSWYAFDRWAL